MTKVVVGMCERCWLSQNLKNIKRLAADWSLENMTPDMIPY
jgi:hypothetical protein